MSCPTNNVTSRGGNGFVLIIILYIFLPTLLYGKGLTMKKRILSFLLAVCMILPLIPLSAILAALTRSTEIPVVR